MRRRRYAAVPPCTAVCRQPPACATPPRPARLRRSPAPMCFADDASAGTPHAATHVGDSDGMRAAALFLAQAAIRIVPAPGTRRNTRQRGTASFAAAPRQQARRHTFYSPEERRGRGSRGAQAAEAGAKSIAARGDSTPVFTRPFLSPLIFHALPFLLRRAPPTRRHGRPAAPSFSTCTPQRMPVAA